MAPKANHLICIAFIACIFCLTSCSPQETPAPAASVPTHVLTQDKAGALTLAEQGDLLEVRLVEQPSTSGTWRLLQQTGSGRAESLGPAMLVHDKTGTKRIFRFRAAQIGTLVLAFVFQEPNKTPQPEVGVAFSITIK